MSLSPPLPGEVTGYLAKLGPNSSGKSTTVKMITGLLDPSDGEILYRGRPIRENLVGFERILGYVPDELYLYPHLTGAEYLELGNLRDLRAATLPGKISALLELFSLAGDRRAHFLLLQRRAPEGSDLRCDSPRSRADHTR